MDEINVTSVEKLQDSRYVRPMQVTYTQKDGGERKWDYIRAHDSVAVVIYNISSKCLVMVKQFRPAIFMHECHRRHETNGNKNKTVVEVAKEVPADIGILYECCAGIADKDGKSMEELASMEVLEETGYKVPPDKFELISKYRSGVGTHGSEQTLFYVEVTNEMKVSEGGGLESEGEMIETVDLPIKDIPKFLSDNTSLNRPISVMYALTWFLSNKLQHHL